MTRRTTTRRGARPADRETTTAPATDAAQALPDAANAVDEAGDGAVDGAGDGAVDSAVDGAAEAAGTTGAEAVLALEGELTIHYAAERRTELLALVERGDRLWADLSEVTELDTAGLQLLLLVRREAASQGKTFEIRAASKAVTEALEIVRLGLALEPLAPAAGGAR